jgi:hypothetical protein
MFEDFDGEDFDDAFEDIPENIDTFPQELSENDDEECSENDLSEKNLSENDGSTISLVSSQKQTLKPVKTRKFIGLYEFIAVVTKLADYLFHVEDLSDVAPLNMIGIGTYVNHTQLAWKLLRNGIFNATLDRAIEKVSFSELEINPFWIEFMESNFEAHKEAFDEDVLRRLLQKH